MLPENIVLQSSGSLSVAVLALIMFILQVMLFFNRPQNTLYAWGAAISFSALLYSVGIFIEYNTAQGSLNRFSGLLEYTAIIFLVHCLYGFTFSYLVIKSLRYHIIAGIFHSFVLILLWSTNSIVADSFVSLNFIGLVSPYIEPALGPLGLLFILYAVIASMCVTIFWIKHKKIRQKYRIIYLSGLGFWFLLGAHDALASLGLPTFQYLMEYGFIGFAMVVLWVIFRSYLESSEEEKYRVITEFATDSILVIQKEKIVFKNRACYDLFGWISEDSVTNKIFNLVVPEKKETVLKYFNTILEGGHVTNPFTIHIRRENGEQRFVEIASSLLHYRDKPAVLTIMRDMTERKQVEDALHRSEKKLSRAKKMETIGLLAGGVAHDLNNILSGIVSYPELLLMDLPKNSKLRKPVETIKSSGLRAAAIVQDLLTVARGVATTKKPLNLNDIIDDYLISPEFIKLKQFHSSVSFSTNIDRNLLNISGSQVHIRKVVMNLVSNASEAIDDSGNVSISTENRYLDRPLKGYDEINIGEYAVLSVSDDGPGISPDDLERIFEPFYTKKLMGRSGTGLGLTVVWNTVQDHNGYIHVIADENGTTFELYFLITRDEILDTDQRLPIKDYKGNKETILVVDDVESQREISCKMLDILGYNTKAVSSGEKAVEYLKLHNVDLVLLDMIMDPGINGRETYEMIIQIHPQQKAIIASGYAQTDEVKKAQQLGVSQFIRKPFTLERIGLAVKKGLKK